MPSHEPRFGSLASAGKCSYPFLSSLIGARLADGRRQAQPRQGAHRGVPQLQQAVRPERGREGAGEGRGSGKRGCQGGSTAAPRRVAGPDVCTDTPGCGGQTRPLLRGSLLSGSSRLVACLVLALSPAAANTRSHPCAVTDGSTLPRSTQRPLPRTLTGCGRGFDRGLIGLTGCPTCPQKVQHAWHTRPWLHQHARTHTRAHAHTHTQQPA